MMLTLPKRGSRISHVETVVYETDRDNASGAELSGVTNVGVDWDIDRAGSKSRVDIATHKRVLRDGMWIAPYLRITPEVGDVIEQQLGHFRLGLPTTVTDGSVDTWGDDKIEQSATGSDIVDLLAYASLPFTYYTPANGLVMPDVLFAIKMASAGVIGPNILPNGGFEQEATGWTPTTGSNGLSGVTYIYDFTNPAAAEGKKKIGFTFPAGAPAEGYAYAQSDLIPVPAGAEKLMLSGFLSARHDHGGYLSLRFQDADGAELPSSTRINTQSWDTPTVSYYAWYRRYGFGNVPTNAVTFRVFVFLKAREYISGMSRSSWDDIQVRTITNDPIPDSRVNLPPSTATASTRIQTVGGASIGYDAINADRLAAIGHHAIYTDLTGRLTTSPSRDIGSATVARTYTEDDYRFVGATEVQRSASNRYNTVTAVKESFEEGVAPLVATVWNDDPNDPWSVHHLGNVRYPNGPLMVQDAVDKAALESAAMATLARATEQHELRIQVLPDPTLTVHNVIEIVGGPEEAQGRWLVEYLRPGTSAGDPIVEIGARRTLASVEVSNE